MADSNIKVEHTVKGLAAGGGGSPARQSTATSMSSRQVATEIKKVLKDSNKIDTKSLESLFEKFLRKFERASTKTGGTAPGGLSNAEVRSYARILADMLAKQLLSGIASTIGRGATGAGSEKSFAQFERSFSKSSDMIVKSLNSLLSQKGIQIDSKDMNELKRILAQGSKSAISPELKSAVKDIGGSAKSMKDSASLILKAVLEANRMRKSGGGFDPTEIVKYYKLAKEINREYKNLKTTSKETAESLKAITGEAKKLTTELSKTADRARKGMSGMRERAVADPMMIVKPVVNQIEKTLKDIARKMESKGIEVPAELTNAIKGLKDAKDIASAMNNAGKATKELINQIKSGNIASGDLKDSINKLTGYIDKLPKTVGGAGDGIQSKQWKEFTNTLNKFLSMFDKVSKTFETVIKIKVDAREIKKVVKEAATEGFNEATKVLKKSLDNSFATVGKDLKTILDTAQLKVSKEVKTRVSARMADARTAYGAGDVGGAAKKVKEAVGMLPKSAKNFTYIEKHLTELETAYGTMVKDVKSEDVKKIFAPMTPAVKEAAQSFIALGTDVEDLRKETNAEFKKLIEGIRSVKLAPGVGGQKAELSALADRLEKAYDISSIQTLDATLNQATSEIQKWDLPEVTKTLQRLKGAGTELHNALATSDRFIKTERDTAGDDKKISAAKKKAAQAWEDQADVVDKQTDEIRREPAPVAAAPPVKPPERPSTVPMDQPREPGGRGEIPGKLPVGAYSPRFFPKKSGGYNIKPGQPVTLTGEGEVREAVANYATDLAMSLQALQEDVKQSLLDGFKKAETGWDISSDFKRISNEWVLEIANVTGKGGLIERAKAAGRPVREGATPQEALAEYKSAQKADIFRKHGSGESKAAKIGEWIKTQTAEALELSFEGEIGRILASIKQAHGGTDVGKDMIQHITTVLGNNIETIFTDTFVKKEIEQRLAKQGLIKKLSIPAADLDVQGTAVFGTAHGSARALPKFATYKTGFENLYNAMDEFKRITAEGQKIPAIGRHAKGRYAEEIRKIGMRPKGENLRLAQDLANDMLEAINELGVQGKEFIIQQYSEAATMVGAKRARMGIEGFSIADYQEKFKNTFSNLITSSDPADKSFKALSKAMQDMGVSAYDVVKSMESIDIENVYDMYRKVLKGPDPKKTMDLLMKGQPVPKRLESPIARVAQIPGYDQTIRGFETTIREIRQLMPIIEPGAPKRGKHQEDVLITMFQTSDIFQDVEDELRYNDAVIKRKIQDINMNLRDMLNEYDELNKAGAAATAEMAERVKRYTKLPDPTRAVPGGVRDIRRIGSLGIPEEQASSYKEYRPGYTTEGSTGLGVLNATAIKTYTSELLDMAPFGEFNRLGRTVHNVNAAMSTMYDRETAKGGAPQTYGVGGVTGWTEFPSLRTTKERDVIESGRYGGAGYGFDVIAELRHTAATFEDQVVVSNRLLDAMTQAVSVLVKPGLKGREGQPPPTAAGGVSQIQEGSILRDVTGKMADTLEQTVGDVSKEFMQILGASQKYPGRAEAALIEEVKKSQVTLQGESVEVQRARLIEIFLNQAGRKFATRYGTKGVSVSTGDLGETTRPKAMGQLGTELISGLRGRVGGVDVNELRKQLVDSGNKFIIDIFSVPTNKIAEAMMDPKEVEAQGAVFKDFAKVVKKSFGVDLQRDIAGIKQLQKLYMEKGGAGLTETVPIDIRISAHGIAKRGLQPEFMESIMGNVIGMSGQPGRGPTTTVQPRMPQETYEKLFGTIEKRGGEFTGTMGELSKYSEALGFKGAGKDIEAITQELISEGYDETIAKKAAALEAMSNYYSTVENEFGKATSLIGPKFIQIVEEPHETKEWKPKEIEELKKGGRLNLPAFGAYAAIFGEDSAMLDQMLGRGGGGGAGEAFRTEDMKKHWEYLKTLQMMDVSELGRIKSNEIKKIMNVIPLKELEEFEKHSGRFGEPGEKGERIISGTILDVEKYPTPFMTEIPTGKGPEGEMTTEPFYIPGPLARQTYPEPLVAGEYGMETPVRRLQHVINMAKKAEKSITGKGLDRKDIERYLPGKIVGSVLEGRKGGLQGRKDVFAQLQEGLRSLPVEEAYRTEKEHKYYGRAGKDYEQGITELEYIEEFLNRKIGAFKEKGTIKSEEDAYDLAIHRIIDILLGPHPETKRLGGTRTDLGDAPSRFSKLLEEEGTAPLEVFMDDLKVRITSEEVIAGALSNLEKAKVDYMKELAKVALGKKGSIASTMFLRKAPTYMAKATTAVVDKTKDLKLFSQALKQMAAQDDMSEFSNEFLAIADTIEDIREDHRKVIEKYINIGVPVLEQTELGVPERIAKKIPVSFEKKYGISDERGVYKKRIPEQMQKSNLAEMMKYKEDLKEALKITKIKEEPEDYEIMKKELLAFIASELQPYIESIRYPFTGTSTVQPYKAKILKPREGDRDIQKYALQVPGVPEMRLGGPEGFQKQMEKLLSTKKGEEGIRTKLFERRESLQRDVDMGLGVPTDAIEKLTKTIDALDKVISDVLPKYTAVQQKLDFDGDQIQIHSGILKEARGEIEKHFKAVTEFRPGTAEAWRTKWTSEEVLPSTSQKYPLADILRGSEKKWEPRKGYEFLQRPEATQTMGFLRPAEILTILGELMAEFKGKRVEEGMALGESPVKPEVLGSLLKQVAQDFVREHQYLQNIESAVDIATQAEGANAESIIMALNKLEAPIASLVENALKQHLFEQKYADAILAQLYKLHLGSDTEAIYRIHRVAERRMGFGGGMIDSDKEYRTEGSSSFRKRWPKNLGMFGELKPEEEIHTYINELERFATQKGMDVKLASDKAVAGSIAKFLSTGQKGAMELIEEIGLGAMQANEDYKQLYEFAKTSEAEIKNRLGSMSTADIIGEITQIREAKGLPKMTFSGTGKRTAAIDEAVKQIGFEGFLVEMAKQIEEDAVDAWVSRIKSLTDEEQRKLYDFTPGVTDPKVWAKQRVEFERQGRAREVENIDVGRLTNEAMPFYKYRGFSTTPKSIAGRFEATSERDIEVPERVAAAGKKVTDDYLTAQRVAQSIARDFREAGQRAGSGGAYNQMVLSTLENIHQDQLKVQSYLNDIRKEGYSTDVRSTFGELGEKVVEFKQSAAGLPKVFADILGKRSGEGPREFERRKQADVDRMSRLAGVPMLSDKAKTDIEDAAVAIDEYAKSLEKREDYAPGKQGEKEHVAAVNKLVEPLLKQTYALAQLEKVIYAMHFKETEGAFIENMLPTLEKIQTSLGDEISSQIVPITRAQSQEQKVRIRESDNARRQREAADDQMGRDPDQEPPRIGGGGRGMFTGYDGEIIRVHIESVKDGIGLSFTPVGAAQGAIDAVGAGGALYDINELRELQKKTGPTRTKAATKADIFAASSLLGGGPYGYKGEFGGDEFTEAQIQSIMKRMAPAKGEKGISFRAESTSMIGTALHEVIGKQVKEEAMAEGTYDYDIERIITYWNDLFEVNVSGMVDLIRQRKDEADNLIDDTIIDIKTVSGSMVSRLSEVGEIKDLGELQKKGIITQEDRRKLEETASQLNLYMAAVAEANGIAAKALKGEAWFYDREDLENMAPVTFKFDAARLERDLAAVAEARQRIQAEQTKEREAWEQKYPRRLEEGRKFKPTREFAPATHPEDLARMEEKRQERAKQGQYSGLSELESQKLLQGGRRYYEEVKRYPWLGEVSYSGKDRMPPRVDPSHFKSAKYEKFQEYSLPKAPIRGKEVGAYLENLKLMHTAAKDYWADVGKMGFDTLDFTSMSDQVKDVLSDIKATGPKGKGKVFMELLSQLRSTEEISGAEMSKAWKYYRIAVGDYYLKIAESADSMHDQLLSAGDKGAAGDEYRKMQNAVNEMQAFMKRGLGKPTDIYTHRRRFVSPDLAEATDLYMTPAQLLQKSKEPLGDSPKLRELFEKSVVGDVVSGGRLTAPIQKAREVFSGLSEVNKGMVEILSNADKFKRVGEEVQNAWRFDKVIGNISKIRAALEDFLRFKFQEGEDVVEKKNLEETLKYIKNLESAYVAFDPKKLMGKVTPGMEGDMGLAKIPRWLTPKFQKAMHGRNLQMVREYYRRTEDLGGPAAGVRYTYKMPIFGESGDVIQETAAHFKKWADTINFAGERVGIFKEKYQDLMEFTQGGNKTFQAAIARAAKWGVASKIVYGGWRKLGETIGIWGDIEESIARLRMVMSPLETNFDTLGKAAVGFAKQYGVSIKQVLDGMRIFAQQGLSQAEVIDRTRISTLAANVTSLSAKEATEALTAAMKIYGSEGEGVVRFLDSWSEVEARHAITADDMANALKKSAAAAKNAGFSFDQLNGVIAAIGSTTRQSGKEVGTSLRFIFRRLTSEKAPKELMKLNIPVLTGGAELRSGFDILNDLSDAWKDLTSAQKMNISQAIGGTRQYNALLVLMDHWDEALEAIEHSTNAKGSAERRNLELMKTYNKQMEQLKVAATEVSMEFGKILMPTFKFGINASKVMLEAFSAMPGSVKATLAAVTGVFTYLSKGEGVIKSIFDAMLIGRAKVSGIFRSLSSEFRDAQYELLGVGEGKSYAKNLKTTVQYTQGGEETATRFRELHTSLGVTKFLIQRLGEGYNAVLGDMVVGSGKFAGILEKGVKNVGKTIQGLGSAGIIKNLAEFAISLGTSIPDVIEGALSAGLYIAGKSVEETADIVLGGISDVLGAGGEKLLTSFVSNISPQLGGMEKLKETGYGLLKAFAPLITSLFVFYKALASGSGYYNRITKNAIDFQKAQYGAVRQSDSQLESIQRQISAYKNLEKQLEDISKLQDPKTVEKRKQLGSFVSPILEMDKAIKASRKYANTTAKQSQATVAGYDEYGNAILRSADSYNKYNEIAKRVNQDERARLDATIASRYALDLTTKGGGEKWKAIFRDILKEIPFGVGEAAGDLVKLSPAAAIDELVEKFNKLNQIKAQYPLSTAVDADLKKLTEGIAEAKSLFDEMYSNYVRVIKDMNLVGLDTDTISSILSTPELQKGFEVMIDIEPRFNLIRKVTPADIIGGEILKTLAPEFKSDIDAIGELTAARLQSVTEKGVPRTKPTTKLYRGQSYLATFLPSADELDMNSRQAVIRFQKNADDTFTAMAQYFNTKTLKVETRPFDESMQDMVEFIFPSRALESEVASNIDQFNEFVAGASAGLRGISKKDFKRDFSLGERFFGDVPTSTVLQGSKGYTPGIGYGESPFQKGWGEDIKKYFFDPMEEYDKKRELFAKVREGGELDLKIDPKTTAEIKELQELLKNNQVVFQYRAVWVDMTKAMEQSMRVTKEAIAVEKERLDAVRVVAGELAGMPEDMVGGIDLGVRDRSQLTTQQLSYQASPVARQLSAIAKELMTTRKGMITRLEKVAAGKEWLKNIQQYSQDFDVTIDEKDLADYTQAIARGVLPEQADLVVHAKDTASNTKRMAEGIDDLLASQGWPPAVEAWITNQSKEATTPREMAEALERLGERRRHEGGGVEPRTLMLINKQMDILSQRLAKKAGLEGGIRALKEVQMVGGGPIGFDYEKDILPKEFIQRAFPAGTDVSKLLNLVKQEIGKATTGPSVPNVRDLLETELYTVLPSRSDMLGSFTDNTKDLVSLQKEHLGTSRINTKTAQKALLAIAIWTGFNKKYSNDAIVKYEEQIKVMEARMYQEMKLGVPEGQIRKRQEDIVVTKEALERERASANLYGQVATFAGLGVGMSELARTFGMTEDSIKALGAGTMGLYLAFELLSRLTGGELPDSVLKMRDAVKTVVKEVAATKDPKKIGIVALKELKNAGQAFKADYEKRASKVREDVAAQMEGLDIDALQKSFDKLPGIIRGKELELVEFRGKGPKYEEYAALYERQLSKRVDVFGKKRSGFGTKEYQDLIKMQVAEQGKFFRGLRGEETTEGEDLGEQIRGKFPFKEAMTVGTEYFKQVRKSFDAQEAGRESFIQGREGSNVVTEDMIKAIITGHAVTIQGTVIRQQEDRTRFATRGGQQEEQAEELYSVYKKHSERVQAILTSLTTAKEQEEKFKYDKEEEQRSLDTQKEFTKVMGDSNLALKMQKEHLKALDEVQKSVIDELNRLDESLGAVSKAAEGLDKGMRDVHIQEFTEALPGVRQYRENIARLFGGGGSEARVAVSVEEEQQAGMVGVQLRHMRSTRWEKEEAQLKRQLMTATGQEEYDVSRRLLNLPEDRRRAQEEEKQARANEQLRRQAGVYEQHLADLSEARYKAEAGSDLERDIDELMTAISEMLEKSTDVVTQKQALLALEAGKGELSTKEYKAEKAAIMEAGPEQYRSIHLYQRQGAIKEGLQKIYKAADTDKQLLDKIAQETASTAESVADGGHIGQSLVDQRTELEAQTALLTSIDQKTEKLPEKKVEAEGMATGGRIFGEGGPREDKVPAMLSPGEFVVRAAAAQRIGYGALEAMNKHGVPAFQDGGGFISNTLGKNVGNIDEFIKVMSDARITKAKELPDASSGFDQLKIFATQGALATGELATRLFIKTPADLANLAGQMGGSLKEHGLFGTLGKGADMAKAMASKEGLKAIGGMIKEDISRGGMGVTTGILEAVAGGATAYNALKPGVGSKAVNITGKAKPDLFKAIRDSIPSQKVSKLQASTTDVPGWYAEQMPSLREQSIDSFTKSIGTPVEQMVKDGMNVGDIADRFKNVNKILGEVESITSGYTNKAIEKGKFLYNNPESVKHYEAARTVKKAEVEELFKLTKLPNATEAVWDEIPFRTIEGQYFREAVEFATAAKDPKIVNSMSKLARQWVEDTRAQKQLLDFTPFAAGGRIFGEGGSTEDKIPVRGLGQKGLDLIPNMMGMNLGGDPAERWKGYERTKDAKGVTRYSKTLSIYDSVTGKTYYPKDAEEAKAIQAQLAKAREMEVKAQSEQSMFESLATGKTQRLTGLTDKEKLAPGQRSADGVRYFTGDAQGVQEVSGIEDFKRHQEEVGSALGSLGDAKTAVAEDLKRRGTFGDAKAAVVKDLMRQKEEITATTKSIGATKKKDKIIEGIKAHEALSKKISPDKEDTPGKDSKSWVATMKKANAAVLEDTTAIKSPVPGRSDPYLFKKQGLGPDGLPVGHGGPAEARQKMKDQQAEAKKLKERFAASKKGMVEQRKAFGEFGIPWENVHTLLSGYQGDLHRSVPLWSTREGFISDEDLKAVVPKKGYSGMDDPAYKKKVEDRKKARTELTGMVKPNIKEDAHKKSMEALRNVNRLFPGDPKYLKKQKELTEKFEKAAIKSYKDTEIEISPEDYRKLQSQEKMFVQMHRNAKALYDVYFGDDKKALKTKYPDLDKRKNLVLRQLTYTGEILSKIGAGENYMDLIITAQGSRDKYGRMKEVTMGNRAWQLDHIMNAWQGQKTEGDWDKTLKDTILEGEKYGIGAPYGRELIKYIKEREGANWIDKRMLDLRDWWVFRPGSKTKDEQGRKDSFYESLKGYYKKQREQGLDEDYEKELIGRKGLPSLKAGGSIDSMRVMHHGGFVNKSGPAFLQKGEVVFPKSFADGGVVESDVATEALRGTLKIKLDVEELRVLWETELKVEDTELKVEDKVLSVDQTPLPVEDKIFTAVIEDPTIEVIIDAGTIASDIASAISAAVSDITVKVENATGGAVGADEVNIIAETVAKVDDRLITLNKELESKIDMVGASVEGTIMDKVNLAVNNTIDRVVLEVRDIDKRIDYLRQDKERQKQLDDYRFEDLRRKIDEISNFVV